MVEPLNPAVREALKNAHKGLDDAMIDRIEELTYQRFQIDPEVDPATIEAIDQERMRLIKTYIPRYEEVLKQLKQLKK